MRKDFTPAVATVTTKKIVDAGETVSDKVTSKTTGADNHWPKNMELLATGYYFDGISASDLNAPLNPSDGESVETFLDRIARRGHRPAAYGSATFTGSEQTKTVTATSEPGGAEEYHAPARGGIGTWVWAFEVEKLSDTARQYIGKDVVRANT